MSVTASLKKGDPHPDGGFVAFCRRCGSMIRAINRRQAMLGRRPCAGCCYNPKHPAHIARMKKLAGEI